MLEYIILGFLMDRELSGYDLKQTMASSTSYFFDASFGSIYPALKKLETRGDVRATEVVDGGKFKKLYAIQATGRETFRAWLAGPIPFSRTKPDHLIPVFFYRFLSPEERKERLEKLISEAQAVLGELAAQEEDVACKADLYQHSALAFGLQYYRLVIDWCRRLLQEDAVTSYIETGDGGQ
ncbi:MAG: PadR family transcriptional regulator [Paenibacillaceae bacterium]|nr:PadR family transcriptional regulator [Paenibacillaceae bacterium]